MKYRTPNIISRNKSNGISSFHGHVFSPASRAYFAWLAGEIDEGALNQRESGKFFPETADNLPDPSAADDQPNSLPPLDGKIASAGESTGQMLDNPGSHWTKHDVLAGDVLDVSWNYSMKHKTRRWKYFMTRTDWNPNLPLSRAQFEDKPFFMVQLNEQPHWSVDSEFALMPLDPTIHELILPQRSGYHVLLAVWEVANTGNAFYHVIDLDFVGEGGSDQPLPPANLRATNITKDSVSLAWNASVSDVAHYQIYRDGVFLAQTTTLNWIDSNLKAGTKYIYTVSTIDTTGIASYLSTPLLVETLAENGDNALPSAPKNLHSMTVTENSLELMWGASTSSTGLKSYLVYREGEEIAEVLVPQNTFQETGLSPDTTYRYFVAAQDTQGRLSVPSNVYSVTTLAKSDGGGGDGGGDGGGNGSIHPAWELGATYDAGDKVNNLGRDWVCIAFHIAHEPTWAPGDIDYKTLWSLIS